MKKILLAFVALAALGMQSANAAPKILYVGDSIAVETSDVVAWWSHNYIQADTSRIMFGGLAICDFTESTGESTLRAHVKSDKPDIVVMQFVGNRFTTCMQNLADDNAYYAKYYADAENATKQITEAAKEAGIPRPKIMWVLQGPTQNSMHAKRMITQYREIAAKHGDLVSDAGAEVSAAAFPDADYESKRYEFTFFVPCSEFEKAAGFCTDTSLNLARVHREDDGTHYCLGKVEGFSCTIPSPGILRYGMRIAQDIQSALSL